MSVEEAIPLIDNLLTNNKIDAPSLVQLADLFRRKALETVDVALKGEYIQKALFALQRATRINPQNALAWTRLGHFYLYYLDDFSNAIEAFLKAYSKYGNNWELNTALGQAYFS